MPTPTRCVLASVVDPDDAHLYRLIRLTHGQPKMTHILERQRDPSSAWQPVCTVGVTGSETGTVRLPASVLHNLLSRIPDR